MQAAQYHTLAGPFRPALFNNLVWQPWRHGPMHTLHSHDVLAVEVFWTSYCNHLFEGPFQNSLSDWMSLPTIYRWSKAWV